VGLPADFGILDPSSMDNHTENYNNIHEHQFQNQERFDVHADSLGIRRSNESVGDQIVKINAQNTIHANSPHSNASFVSKIPKIGGLKLPRYPLPSSVMQSDGNRADGERQEDVIKLHGSNVQLRDTVLIVVEKLENFIEKTKLVKETKK
jgi:hypothetical protein